MKLLNSLSERSFITLVVLVAIVSVILGWFLGYVITDALNCLDREEIACLHPVDDSMRIYVYNCLEEGYNFGQCYTEYSDFLNGSERLEMPTTWV